MATKKTSKKKSRKNWQENYASFILGAIIVVILGLLVANFITNRNKDITKTGEQAAADQTKDLETIKAAASKGEYKVQANDSLSKIAEQVYGDKALWPVLAKVNNIVNPNLIYADVSLKIPTKEEAGKVKDTMSQTSYTVESGDTLFKIAETVYGDGSKWGLIDSANKVGRLPNGNPLIFAGNTLVIPR